MSHKAQSTRVQPPEDAFYQRYSPHHEMPLSFAGSLFLHAAVIIALFAGGMGIWLVRNEAGQPPSMDVVMFSGEGEGGLGGIPGLPGSGGPKSEFVPEAAGQNNAKTDSNTAPLLKEIPRQEFDIPDGPMAQTPDDVLRELALLSKDAEKVQSELKKAAATTKPAGTSKETKFAKSNGTGGVKGGTGSSGTGTGGAGSGGTGGTGGTGGSPRQLSKREIFAARWRFDLTGNARQHAEKLAAAGVIVVLPEPRGRFFVRIDDLKRRPVELKPINLPRFEDAVQWRNDDYTSRDTLSKELRLPYVPAFIVLLLPQNRELKMADVEAEFAERTGRDLKGVRATLFDFQLQNGKYEPVVLAQE